VLDEPAELGIDVGKRVSVKASRNRNLFGRELVEREGEGRVLRSEPSRKVRRDFVRGVAVLQVHVDEKRLLGRAIADPTDGFPDRVSIVDFACPFRALHPLVEARVARGYVGGSVESLRVKEEIQTARVEEMDHPAPIFVL